MPQSYQTQAATDGEKNQEPTIVIGIDFGTTYSGVAWTTSSRSGHINIITNWDAVKNYCSDKEKVPSVIHYDDKGEVSWGYSVPEKASSLKFQWFKLCLLDEGDIPKDLRNAAQIQSAQKSLRESNKHVEDVISDYLRELWTHSITNIRRAVGGQLVDISKFKVVVTIPAIWPSYTQPRMIRAIKKAGILESRIAGDTVLKFITEPEAAALATINDMCTYNSRPDMEVGDHFIVCDAGGGTVDVITYTVIQTDPIRVEESVKGDGKLCGATFLDDLFLTALRNKIDKISPNAFKVLEESGGLNRIIHNDWENGIKPQFRNTNQHWLVQMPSSGSNRKRTHDQFRFSDIKFKAKDVQGIFTPIVAEIETLITVQASTVKIKYKKEPKFLVLVGGFGRQLFLYTRLQDLLNRKKGQKEKTEILQGSGAEPRVDFDVKMISNGVTLDFEIIYNGQVMASKNFGIDYTGCGSTMNQSEGDYKSEEDSEDD
ncbi:hypothetical protein A0O28_0086420 [Trichoderma guizhouense]|uniref:Uncharacterized protein n=1 Tax=Trichoderma guizhouense TaxID=1491466 RepID=A0A1T3CPK4_9HYPO|nr:hypothetical protein A0O28_0086420 [Trichoderma guizhouense]